jgi:hypothetical protein
MRRKITLEWFASLVGGCSPRVAVSPCPPWPWGFFLEEEDERCEMMEVYVNGFAGHQGGYFISRESASRVMTGWCALMGIPNGRGFSPDAKGSFIEQCSWLPNKDFLRILR